MRSIVRRHAPSLVTGLVGAVVGAILLGGAAYAANGGSFLLGRANAETATATLTNSAGTPLSLVAKSGYAPLKVNTAVKVASLNADWLDGLDSTAFLRTTGTAANAAKLGNVPAASYLQAGQVLVGRMSVPMTDQGGGLFAGTATCPAGTIVLGGGADSASSYLYTSRPDGSNGWFGETDSAGDTFALCLSLTGSLPAPLTAA